MGMHLLMYIVDILELIFILAFELCYGRDGVSESQFNQVLNVELEQIIQVSLLPFKHLETGTATNSLLFNLDNLEKWLLLIVI